MGYSLEIVKSFCRIHAVHGTMTSFAEKGKFDCTLSIQSKSEKELAIEIERCKNYLKIVKRDLQLLRKGKIEKFCQLLKYSIN